ncbi:MAG: SCO family protein [Stenotrophobium sp.]
MTDAPINHQNRRTLILLALLFIAPMAAGYLLHFVFPQFQPSGKTNYGVLLTPARPLPHIEFTDIDGRRVDTSVLTKRWSYIFLAREHCDDACRAKIHQIRQIRILLNQDTIRLQRVYIAPDLQALRSARELLSAENPDLVYLADTSATGDRAVDFFKPTEPDAIYLTDTRANWVMTYPAAHSESKGLLKDIKTLLKLSMDAVKSGSLQISPPANP